MSVTLSRSAHQLVLVMVPALNPPFSRSPRNWAGSVSPKTASPKRPSLRALVVVVVDSVDDVLTLLTRW